MNGVSTTGRDRTTRGGERAGDVADDDDTGTTRTTYQIGRAHV